MEDDQLKLLVEETVKQNIYQDKQLRMLRLLLGLLAALVLLLGYFCLSLSRDVTEMCTTITNTLSEDNISVIVSAISQLQDQVEELDMATLNNKLNQLDVDALNDALNGLTAASDRIYDVLSTFSGGTLGGLFS